MTEKARRISFCLIAIILLLASRALCLTHEMYNHPDEIVFEYSSNSMARAILDPVNEEYKERKPYPEGSYVFYAPFQMFALKCLPEDFPARTVNRIAAVIYYILGCLLGMKLADRYFNRTTAIMYLLLMLFSLLFIEQSRYGTGDAISIFLLMLVAYLCARWLEEPSLRMRILAAFGVVGVLASIKYPQIYFIIIPISAVCLKRDVRRKAFIFVGGGILVIGGFALFSPMVVRDWRYILEVCAREMDAYVYTGSRVESGGFVNHLLSTICYWTLYSDMLFSPVFCWIAIKHKKTDGTQTDVFFKYILPATALVFLIYNLFVKTNFFRTMVPFFAIAVIYAANGLSLLLGKRRALTIALLLIFVARGAFYISAMIPYSAQQHLLDCIDQAFEISGDAAKEQIVGVGLDSYFPGRGKNKPECFKTADNHSMDELRDIGFPELQVGDVAVTGSMEFDRAEPYFIEIDNAILTDFIRGWQSFKSKYAEAYVGQSYPEYYGYLFGFWIKGTTSAFDFPMNYVYAVR